MVRFPPVSERRALDLGLLLAALVLLAPLFVPSFLAYPGVQGPGLLARFTITVLLLVFVARGGQWPRGPVAYAALAYAAIALLATATGVDPMLSLGGTPWRMTGVFDQLLWLLFAGMLPSLVQGRWGLVWGLVAGAGGLMAAMGIVEAAWWSEAAFVGRITAGTGNPGVLAAFLVPTVIAAVMLARRHWAWYAVAVLADVALYLTGTRGAMLAAAVAMLLLVAMVRERPLRLASLALVVLLAGLQFGVGVSGGASRGAVPGSDEVAVEHRSNLQRTALLAFSERPLVGWGPGAFVVADERYAPDAPERADSPHNLVLQEMVEKGLLGLVTFAFVAVLAWRVRREPLPLAVLAGLCVYGLFWFASPHWWLWFAVVLGVAIEADQHLAQPLHAHHEDGERCEHGGQPDSDNEPQGQVEAR